MTKLDNDVRNITHIKNITELQASLTLCDEGQKMEQVEESFFLRFRYGELRFDQRNWVTSLFRALT